jgi:sulfide dehydrogenase [flavocytochrome c] flavoprotein subunit
MSAPAWWPTGSRPQRPRAKLIVLDANPDFVTERDNFSQAFFGLHANVIEYVTNATVSQVDPANDAGLHQPRRFKGDVVNLIPAEGRP